MERVFLHVNSPSASAFIAMWEWSCHFNPFIFSLEIDFVLSLSLTFDQLKLRSLFFSSLAMLGSGLYNEIGIIISSREYVPA